MKTLKTIAIAAIFLPLLSIGCSKAPDAAQNPALTHPLAVAYPELVGQKFISTTCDKSLIPGRNSKIVYVFERDQFLEKIRYYTDAGCSQEDMTVIYFGKVSISKAVDNPDARSVDLTYTKALLKVLSPDAKRVLDSIQFCGLKNIQPGQTPLDVTNASMAKSAPGSVCTIVPSKNVTRYSRYVVDRGILYMGTGIDASNSPEDETLRPTDVRRDQPLIKATQP